MQKTRPRLAKPPNPQLRVISLHGQEEPGREFRRDLRCEGLPAPGARGVPGSSLGQHRSEVRAVTLARFGAAKCFAEISVHGADEGLSLILSRTPRNPHVSGSPA